MKEVHKSRLLQKLVLDEVESEKQGTHQDSFYIVDSGAPLHDGMIRADKGKQNVIQTKYWTFRPPTVFWSQIQKRKSHEVCLMEDFLCS